MFRACILIGHKELKIGDLPFSSADYTISVGVQGVERWSRTEGMDAMCSMICPKLRIVHSMVVIGINTVKNLEKGTGRDSETTPTDTLSNIQGILQRIYMMYILSKYSLQFHNFKCLSIYL